MADANRLRDQAMPNVAQRPVPSTSATPGVGPEPSPVESPAVTQPQAGLPSAVAVSGSQPWSIRRIVVVGAGGEIVVLLVAALAGLAGFAAVAVTWIAAHFVLGLFLGMRGDGKKRLAATFAATAVAAIPASIVLTIAILVGVGDNELRSQPGAVLGSTLLGTLMIVLILGSPIVGLGAVMGRIPNRRRERKREAAVGRGEAPLIQPIQPLTRKSVAKAALDDAELAKVTAGGAATRIERTYPWTGGDAMLAADRARLAAVGYLATKVERRPPAGLLKRIVVLLVGILLFVIAFVSEGISGLGDGDFGVSGRIRASFDLVASDHHSVPDNTAL